MANGYGMAAVRTDNADDCLPIATLSATEVSTIAGVFQRAGHGADAVAIRASDGPVIAVLARPAIFALLHRVAAIAGNAEHYNAVQRQALEIREGDVGHRYVEIGDVIGR
jgi:hypothetical protein